MTKAQGAVSIAVAMMFAMSALAQTSSTERIDQRQQNQADRIQKGVDSGQLNQREAERMQKGQARVQQMEDKAAADGKITKGERARIEARQDAESARIARQRHDAQKAHKGEHKGAMKPQ